MTHHLVNTSADIGARTRLARRGPVQWFRGLLALAAAVLLAAGGRALADTAAAPLLTSPWASLHAAKIRLIGGGAFDGGTVPAAGVELMLDANWKTYWRMPGESGVAPQFDFAKSANVAAVEVLYPAPQRFRDQGGDAVGYRTRVVFPLRVTAKDPSKPIMLTGDLALGICREICVPVETQVSLELPPQTGGAAVAIADAVDRVPRIAPKLRPSDPVVSEINGEIASGKRRIDVAVKMPPEAAESADLFIEAPEGLFVPMSKRSGVSGGAVIFTVDFAKLPDAKDLLGKPLRVTAVTATGASETTWTGR